jgi:predicted oxidoreductase
MLHRPDYLADPEEVARAFSRLREQGKVLHFGVSNFRPATLSMIRRACPMPLIAHQVEIHLARLDAFEDGTLDQCLELGITPSSWSPLGRGLFGAGALPQPHEPRAEGLRALVGVLDTRARALGVSRAVLALAWLLRHPAGIIPIVGSADPGRIRDATRADELELSREEWYSTLAAARMQGLP